MFKKIQENYFQVCEEITSTAIRSGRQAEDVRLVVVTKTHPIEAVQAVVESGATFLGENYADEALPKIQSMVDYPEVNWHMIGHVQSRKSGLVANYFDYLHALDSLKLAARLDRQAAEVNRVLPVLIECNTSQEESKYGFPAWDESFWPDLKNKLQILGTYQNLLVKGLMTMAPYADDPEKARPYFARLKKLQEYLAGQLHFSDWSELSMGMSGDFKIAIEEGATWVRIGTRILGARQ